MDFDVGGLWRFWGSGARIREFVVGSTTEYRSPRSSGREPYQIGPLLAAMANLRHPNIRNSISDALIHADVAPFLAKA
jgi:hypothetical protein